VREWTDPAPLVSRFDLLGLVRRQLHPLGSRLSPLRYLGDWRINQYYRRTLSDGSLAEQWRAHYLDGLRIDDNAAVLDHGCGRGRHAGLLGQLGFRVAAQDVATQSWWSHLTGVTFQCVPPSAPTLPWADSSFQLVLDVGVIHYLTDTQLHRLAGEVFRVLVPGGYWLLLEANTASYGARVMRSVIGNLHELSLVRQIARVAGFDEIDVDYEGFYAPVAPRFVQYLTTVMRPAPMELGEWNAPLANRIEPERRKLWRLRLMRPKVG
jgi:SAM-dependent methyltransferase